MITTKLMGGLGNQMFQYATGRSLALKNNEDLVLDISHYQKFFDRHYELGCFRLHREVKIGGPPKNFHDWHQDSPRITRIKKFRHSINNTAKRVTEYGFSYENYGLVGDTTGSVGKFDLSVLESGGNTYLVGFWQSEKYFEEYADQIRKDFQLELPLSKSKKAMEKRIIASDNAVSIHVRRGDFVVNPSTRKFHGLMPLSYYRAALKKIADRVPTPELFVISDDSQWCRDNLQLDRPMTFIESSDGDAHEEMYLMSRCRHHIIANSSFSWWGAWLNPNHEKIVVAPKNWLKDASINTSDIAPQAWIKI